MKIFKKLKEYFKKNFNFSSSSNDLYRCEGYDQYGEFRRHFVTAKSEEDARMMIENDYPSILSWNIYKESQ